MLGANYKTKKALREAVGSPLKYVETSIFGLKYNPNGTFCVVGPDPYRNRKWYATVKMEAGLIKSVK